MMEESANVTQTKEYLMAPIYRRVRLVFGKLVWCCLGFWLTACIHVDGASNSELERIRLADIHGQLAHAYLAVGQVETAREEAEQALKFHSKNARAEHALALALARQGRYGKAEISFKRALANDSDNASIAHDFASFLCQTNRESESIKFFEAAAQKTQSNQRALSLLRANQCKARVK